MQVDAELRRATRPGSQVIGEMRWGPNGEDEADTSENDGGDAGGAAFDVKRARESTVIVKLDDLLPVGVLDEWNSLP